MNRADLNFEVGDCVKVREGVGDPDSDVDISGWQGRVLEIAEDESDRPLILVAWDSYTLKEMPRSPVSREDTTLPGDSVANVSQIITLDKTFFTERVSRVSDRIMMSVEDGIRTVLAL